MTVPEQSTVGDVACDKCLKGLQDTLKDSDVRTVMEDLAEGRYKLLLTILLNCFTSMKHFMGMNPAAVSELKKIAKSDSIMIDHIRNGPSADWIPLNSQSDAWDNDKFWKLMNEALSLASQPATSAPDKENNPRTPATARLGDAKNAVPASRNDNDPPTSKSLENAAVSTPEHSAPDSSQARQTNGRPVPEMDSRYPTGQNSTPVSQQRSQWNQTTSPQAGADLTSSIQHSLPQAAAQQPVIPPQLLTPTPPTQQAADLRCTVQGAYPIGLSNLQYQYNQAAIGYPALAGTDHATIFGASHRPASQWNVNTGLTTMPAMLNQHMPTVQPPSMISNAWPEAQGQGTFVSPGQLAMVGPSTGPALTEPTQNSHWPNGPFTEAGTAGYTNHLDTNASIHQPLQ
ncbi:hypothetical protein CNMCM6106_008740 [Aspergillus hiratsukae]|uniref:Uncharacterized protein n=1 Tax=Aspergillus hiratsukae TaxID=1194566 RepID=A0A8H6QIC4_9EURO|nr:hypothetical protein CNMCM6106_008740 [Aspergillus hiratsukae]